MTLRSLSVLFATCCILAACSRYADDAAVRSVQLLSPSVVLLTMHLPPKNPITDAYDEGYGSGILVASGAWGSDILTVAHVVKGARMLEARFSTGRIVAAQIVASSADRDLALLRVSVPNLPIAHLSSSSNLRTQRGREIGVLGYPIPDEFTDEHLGRAMSFNAGRLSAVRHDALEVMVPIVPGESGGPIFFLDDARIIGIAQSRFADEHSIGFAIPSDDAKEYLHQIDSAHGF
ncbi:MAG: S1C family serine protease [Vulcanimicrobiaceae bacterium]